SSGCAGCRSGSRRAASTSPGASNSPTGSSASREAPDSSGCARHPGAALQGPRSCFKVRVREPQPCRGTPPMTENLDAKPIVVFKTLSNTELGAQLVVVDSNGDIVLRDVLKKVTESMLTSYPRTQLGLWTPNRAAIRYKADQIEARDVRRF